MLLREKKSYDIRSKAIVPRSTIERIRIYEFIVMFFGDNCNGRIITEKDGNDCIKTITTKFVTQSDSGSDRKGDDILGETIGALFDNSEIVNPENGQNHTNEQPSKDDDNNSDDEDVSLNARILDPSGPAIVVG